MQRFCVLCNAHVVSLAHKSIQLDHRSDGVEKSHEHLIRVEEIYSGNQNQIEAADLAGIEESVNLYFLYFSSSQIRERTALCR